VYFINSIFFPVFGYLFSAVWSMDGWEKHTSKFLPIPPGRVQFHQDQIHVLAVHETLIAVYEAPKLECLEHVWSILELSKNLMMLWYQVALNQGLKLKWIPFQNNQ
jgi:hypothetical protein